MIMQNKSSDDLRRPAPQHPWRTRSREAAGNSRTAPSQRHNRKATIAITVTEEQALRARALRAGGLSVSAFLRSQLPPELLSPPDNT